MLQLSSCIVILLDDILILYFQNEFGFIINVQTRDLSKRSCSRRFLVHTSDALGSADGANILNSIEIKLARV